MTDGTRSRSKLSKFSLISACLLMALSAFPIRHAAARNLELIRALRGVGAKSLCDFPDPGVQGLWRVISRRDAGSRNNVFAALYRGMLSDDGRPDVQGWPQTEIDKAGLLLSGLADGCRTAPLKRRIAWAECALRLTAGIPSSIPVLRRLGGFFFKNKLWPRSAELFEELLGKQPSNARSALYLALARFHSKDFAEAERILRRRGPLAETMPVARGIHLAASQYRQGRCEAALKTLQDLEQGHAPSREPLYFYYRGLCHRCLGMRGPALQDFYAVLRLSPENHQSRIHIASLLAEEKEWGRASAMLASLPAEFARRADVSRLMKGIKQAQQRRGSEGDQ